MREEIIIDGVNVAECFYFIDHTPPKGQGDWCGAIHKGACKVYSKDCEYNKDCYYKQLNRLQAENEELKKRQITKNGFICDCEQNVKYRQALEEIREIIDKSCNQCKNEYLNEDYCSGQGDCFKIRQVINEVLE